MAIQLLKYAAHSPNIQGSLVQPVAKMLKHWVKGGPLLTWVDAQSVCCIHSQALNPGIADLEPISQKRSLIPCLISACWVSDTRLDLARTNAAERL
jgi:hypothetical protein